MKSSIQTQEGRRNSFYISSRAGLTRLAQHGWACIVRATVSSSLLAAVSSPAAPIIWGAPTTITANVDISTNGPLVHAGNFRNTTGTVLVTNVLETISFTNRQAQNALGTLLAGEEARVIQGAGGRQTATLFDTNGTVVDPAFQTVLNGSAWENSDPGPAPGLTDMILRVTGAGGTALTNGQTYQIQLFFSDDRAGSAGRAERLHDGVGNYSASFLFSDSPYVTGTFTADGTGYQDVYMQNTSGGGNFPVAINAYVLRKPVTIPVLVGTVSVTPSNTAYAGESRVFSATATGPATGYLWQWDNGTGGATFTTIPGATGLSYTQSTSGLLGSYQYQFLATNVSTAVTSSVVTLTVSAASAPYLTIDVTPSTVSRYTGGSVTFEAMFEGNHPIAYQWQANTGGSFTNIPNATNPTLTLANLQLVNAGSYQLTATNAVGGNVSSAAVLTVNNGALAKFQWAAPVPFNGLGADQILTNVTGAVVGAAAFGGTAYQVTLGNGRIFNFSTDGSIATASGLGTGNGAYPAGTGLTTSNANFDAVLNNYSWDGGPKTINLYNLVAGEQYAVQLFGLDDRSVGGSESNRLASYQDPNDEGDVSATFKMGDNVYVLGIFTATSSTEAIQMNLPTGNAGSINALVLRALSYVPVSQPPTVTADPQSQTVFFGHPASMTVTANSYVLPTIRWQAGPAGGPFTNLDNGGVIFGASSNVLTLTNATAYDGAQFQAVVGNPAGSVVSGAAQLTVVPLPPTSGAGSLAVRSLLPVAYWPLNETNDVSAGSVGAYDAVGIFDGTYLTAAQNAFNGILGVQPADGFPMFATNQGALQCTANTDQSWVTTPALNLNTNTATIGMWIYPEGIQPSAVGLYVNRNAGTVAGLGYYGNDRLGYKWNNDGSDTWGFNSGLLIPTEVWSYVAVAIEPTQAVLYLYNTNGLQTATNIVTHANMTWDGSAANIRIGSDNSTATVFNGKIDEVVVFNRALAAAEIMQLAGEVKLNLQPSGSQFRLTWPYGTLLEAATLAGPWLTNVNVSPYLVSPTGAQKFYRVQIP